jgi:YegS/Rv2252/BmrU family lipid kinase
MKIAIIVNPVAGGGKAKKLAPLAEKRLKEAGHKTQVFISGRQEESMKLAELAAKEGFEIIVACGGDGTVLEVLNGIKSTDAALGVLPWGRGNDVSKDLGLPQGVDGSIETLLNGKEVEVDAAGTGGRLFLGVGGVGLDAQVAVNGNRWRKVLRSDFVAYELGAIVTILYYPPFPLELSLEGKLHLFENTFLVAVGNTSSYSRGMRILPHASFLDGKLDVCVVTSRSRFHLLKLFPTVFRGTHLKDPGIHYFQADQVNLRCLNGAKVYYFADGEIFGTLPTSFVIHPRKVKIILPKE